MTSKELKAIEAELERRGYRKYTHPLTLSGSWAWLKNFDKEEDEEGTVISGWVARDEDADCPRLYNHKPFRKKEGFKDGLWSYGLEIGLRLDPSLFPDITWESDPEPVEITIKRKNHEWRTD